MWSTITICPIGFAEDDGIATIATPWEEPEEYYYDFVGSVENFS